LIFCLQVVSVQAAMRIPVALAALLAAAMALAAGTALAGTAEEDFRRGLSAFNTGDYAMALRMWRPLAENGEARAQAGIGFMYHRGLGVAVDDREAALWLTRAAVQGQAEGELMLGMLFYYGRGVPQSYVRAYAWCDLAESAGNADATLCRDAALESMSSDAERREAFGLVVDLSERYGLHR
jgi:TPR repeat protein